MRYDPQMIVVSVLYPKTAQSHFDLEYYLTKHIPLVKKRFEPFGLKEVRLLRGMAAPDGGAPGLELLGELSFPSAQHLQDALDTHGEEILADIPMFTNVRPTIQINEPI